MKNGHIRSSLIGTVTERGSDIAFFGKNGVVNLKRSLFILKKKLYLWEISNFSHVMQEKDGKYIFGVAKIGDKGQIVIPKDARKIYNMQPGDTLMVLGDQKGIAMINTDIFQKIIDQALEGSAK